MAVFNFKSTVHVDDNQDVILDIRLPDPGTAAHHIIDLPPGNQDLVCVDQCSMKLGKGANLKMERTVIFSKVVNVDANNTDVKVDFFINGQRLISNGIPVGHSNPKTIDPSPQIVVNIKFL